MHANRTNVEFELEGFGPASSVDDIDDLCQSLLQKIVLVYRNLPDELTAIAMLPFSSLDRQMKLKIVALIVTLVNEICIVVPDHICQDPDDGKILLGRRMKANIQQLQAFGVETDTSVIAMLQRREIQQEILLVPQKVHDALVAYGVVLQRPAL